MEDGVENGVENRVGKRGGKAWHWERGLVPVWQQSVAQRWPRPPPLPPALTTPTRLLAFRTTPSGRTGIRHDTDTAQHTWAGAPRPDSQPAARLVCRLPFESRRFPFACRFPERTRPRFPPPPVRSPRSCALRFTFCFFSSSPVRKICKVGHDVPRALRRPSPRRPLLRPRAQITNALCAGRREGRMPASTPKRLSACAPRTNPRHHRASRSARRVRGVSRKHGGDPRRPPARPAASTLYNALKKAPLPAGSTKG